MLLLVFFLLNTLDTSYIRKSSLNEERISENNIHYWTSHQLRTVRLGRVREGGGCQAERGHNPPHHLSQSVTARTVTSHQSASVLRHSAERSLLIFRGRINNLFIIPSLSPPGGHTAGHVLHLQGALYVHLALWSLAEVLQELRLRHAHLVRHLEDQHHRLALHGESPLVGDAAKVPHVQHSGVFHLTESPVVTYSAAAPVAS